MTSRLDRVRDVVVHHGLDALLITPGADLRYASGYAAKPLERLIALVVRANGDPILVAPELEVPAARAAGITLEIHTWGETDDPFAVVADLLPDARTVAVDDEMWAARVFALQRALPQATFSAGGALVSELRMRKDASEIDALSEAGAAIDRVHSRMGEWLRPGRTEREVGADIARAIIDEGHETVDFVIVGSGPNGASPHHDVSDRVIGAGEPVVVDIGGTNAAGYCSDCTRNYVAGGEPDADYLALYEVLLDAQTAQRAAARPGITASELDAVGRDIIAAAGYGHQFIHRTGHGIGQQTHEEPYIIEGSDLVLEPGMAFSIEPGIYVDGRFGARIEDILICTETGADSVNHTPRELVRL